MGHRSSLAQVAIDTLERQARMFEGRSTGRKNRAFRQAVESLETRRLLAAPVFSADFEAPLSVDWQFSGVTSLWHRTSIASQSGSHSLYYGRDVQQNYNVGFSAGTVTTPVINLVGAVNPELQFKYFLSIEPLLAEDVFVEITSDNGASWTTLASDEPIRTEILLANNRGWLTWSGSLSAYVGGSVKLKFSFDSYDDVANAFTGWLVDDVVVTTGDAAPIITSITPDGSAVISGSSTTLQYVFSETVSGVDVTDLTLSGPSAAGATVTGVSGSGNTRTFSVSGLSNGTLTATLAKDAGDIADSAAQSLLPVVTKFRVILPDAYDTAAANATLATASNLGVVVGSRIFSNLTLHTETDADFYKFTADATGSVTLDLAYVIDDLEDADIFAYDSNQALIVEPDPADLDDTITFNVTKGQTYYVHVLSELGLVSSNYTLSVAAPAEAPRVTGVFVKGSGWNASYLSFMGANLANSSATYGYAIPTGATQLQTLPWSNLNTVSIQFSEPVNLAATQLIMVGTSTYNVAASAFTYNAADRVGTWQLPANFVADRLYVKLAGSGAGVVQDLAGLALDGEFTTSSSTFASGNGIAGGDFVFRFDVLPGDSNASGTINSADITQVKTRSGQVIATGNYRSDFNGSNAINSADITFVKTRSGIVLPPAPLGMLSSSLLLSTAKNLLS